MWNTTEIAERVWAEHVDAMPRDLVLLKRQNTVNDEFRPQRTIDPCSQRWYRIFVNRETGEAWVEYSPPAHPRLNQRKSNRA